MTRKRVAIAGIGYSSIHRGNSPAVEDLTVAAAIAALADAGLRPAAVDGIFEYQYAADAPVTNWLQRTLGTGDLSAYCDVGASGASGMAGVSAAYQALIAGECEVALAYRSIQQGRAGTGAFETLNQVPPGSSMFHEELLSPYGAFGIIVQIALKMQRRAAVLGGRPEDYGHIAINARRWSALNERAVLRSPMSMDDYLGARMLADPLRLLDCDYPVSGSCALVLTTEERARDLCQPLVLIDSHATATGAGDWVFGPDFLDGGTLTCAERLWRKASIGRDDINLAGLYDGFTYMTLSWIEALGFCRAGEAGAWLEEGRTIGPGGRLPLNTSGGHLAEGRLHGLSHLAEVVLQLRGQAGSRQVPGASAAVVTNSHGPAVAAMILRRD